MKTRFFSQKPTTETPMPIPDPAPQPAAQPADSATAAKRRPGRPALPPEERVNHRRSKLTLDGPIPAFIGYEDLKVLVRLYRGAFWAEGTFKLWVEDGRVPSYLDTLAPATAYPNVQRRKYRWEEIKTWIDQHMVRATAIVTVNDQPVRRDALPKASGI